LDADAPSREDPTARNLRHYLAGNWSLSSLRSSVLPSAQRLFLPTQDSFPFTPFQQPNPQANTGVHRFIYALYTQPDNFRTANFDSVAMSPETANWNVSIYSGEGGRRSRVASQQRKVS
jgi:phosphatidylethanolamine-binding protein